VRLWAADARVGAVRLQPAAAGAGSESELGAAACARCRAVLGSVATDEARDDAEAAAAASSAECDAASLGRAWLGAGSVRLVLSKHALSCGPGPAGDPLRPHGPATWLAQLVVAGAAAASRSRWLLSDGPPGRPSSRCVAVSAQSWSPLLGARAVGPGAPRVLADAVAFASACRPDALPETPAASVIVSARVWTSGGADPLGWATAADSDAAAEARRPLRLALQRWELTRIVRSLAAGNVVLEASGLVRGGGAGPGWFDAWLPLPPAW